MAALVQTFAPHQSTNTLLQQSTNTPIQSIGNQIPQNNTSNMAQRQYGQGQQQGGQQGNYGGNNRNYGPAPVAPYAFTSTPGLGAQKAQQQQQRQGQPNLAGPMTYAQRVRYPAPESVASSSSGSSAPPSRPVVMTVNRKQEEKRPMSPQVVANTTPTRPTPDRYKRSFKKTENNPPTNGSALPSGSGMAAVGALYYNPPQANSSPSLPAQGRHSPKRSVSGNDDITADAINAPFATTLRSQSVDDIHTYQKPAVTTQHNLQNRRRSFGAFQQVGGEAYNGVITDKESGTGVYRSPSGTRGTAVVEQIRTVSAPRPIQIGSGPQQNQNSQRPALRTVTPIHSFQNPSPNFSRRGSAESSNSATSNQSPKVPSGPSSRPSSAKTDSSNTTTNNADPQIPPRASSADASRRVNGPSPLSKPMTMNPDPNTYQEFPKPTAFKPEASKPATPPQATSSPAADHLAALNNESKKGLKNRLRRALSFGSAAELRRVAVNGHHAEASRHGRGGQLGEDDTETARISRQQEAAGLGEGIYNGQGNIFMGSTDNISVSSTASSASVMLRKMGKGMKRSTRSLVGLFRPKSVIGLSSKSSSTELSAAQVTVVNVEAEQQRAANVNGDPHDQAAGGTGFPKLGADGRSASSRGTDSVRLGTARDEDIRPRTGSISVEKDRQELLAVRKGILKRVGSSSPIVKPSPDFQLPPVTSDEKTEINIDGENYVISEPRFTPASGSNSAPTSPKVHPKYEVVFSPRITFHETWTSGEYDRKGDIATCNRLTPMLAQQIKEELNTFKMEMDVHEESRVYTHFF